MTGHSANMTGFDNGARETQGRLRRTTLRARSARIFATCAQGAWLFLAATPVIVVVCALRG